MDDTLKVVVLTLTPITTASPAEGELPDQLHGKVDTLLELHAKVKPFATNVTVVGLPCPVNRVIPPCAKQAEHKRSVARTEYIFRMRSS